MQSTILRSCLFWYKISLFPNPLFDYLSRWWVHRSFSFLSSIQPFSHVFLMRWVLKCSKTMFLSVQVVSLVVRSISPCKFTLAMEFSLLPSSSIYRFVGISRNTLSIRHECFSIYAALILPAITESHNCLVLGIVVKLNSVVFSAIWVIDQ